MNGKNNSGITGFLLGLVVGAGAILFSKRENREIASEKINEFKDRVGGAVQNIRVKLNQEKEDTEEELEKTRKEMERKKEA